MTTVILTSDDCEMLLDHPTLIDALARAHAALAAGEARQPRPESMPSSVIAAAQSDGAVLIPMTATWNGLAVVKLLSDAPRNRDLGLPAQRSTVALYDAETAECLALIDGRTLTRIRTASATAVATRCLARPAARVLGLIGAGALALEHIRSHEHLGYDEAVVWSRSDSTAQMFVELAPAGVSVMLAATPEQVLAEADVVCTLTPSRVPLVRSADLRPGVHLNAIGSPPRSSFSELAPDVFARADLVVVDAQAVSKPRIRKHLEGPIDGRDRAG